jgi:stage II sporulation protein AA (anti-sigma F factor antagonist)
VAPFAIRVQPFGASGTRLIVEGEIDLLTAPHFKAALDEELASASTVVLDLSSVRFIDSSGLQAIVAALHASTSDDDRLKISSALPAQAQRLFELVGVFDQLPLVDDRH